MSLKYEPSSELRHSHGGGAHMAAVLVVTKVSFSLAETSADLRDHRSEMISDQIQGYLAHKKTPTPLGPPQDPRHRPTVGS